MKNIGKLIALGSLSFLSAGLLLIGCTSTPELTQADALKLIQAKYDHTPAASASIVVNEQGMGQGVDAKLWARTRLYPNHLWADATLTPEGKKAIKLQDGSDVIQWRPESAGDPRYAVTLTTVVANHPRAHDLNNLQDETLPGVATAKGASFTEGLNLDGVPSALQDIAHNPGNKLSTKRQADFSYENGAWVLHSIE